MRFLLYTNATPDTSAQADKYRSTINDEDVAPFIDPRTAGELPITPELKMAFLESLESLNISLRFFAGSWEAFDTLKTIGPAGYDIVLTSETIYRNDSLPPLITLMRAASCGSSDKGSKEYMCLVAAKVLYFGVGGGTSDFLKAVEGAKGTVNTVLERKTGVGRKIMNVQWQ